jgi:hypothetical protein
MIAEDTTITSKSVAEAGRKPHDSRIFNCSVRSIITLSVILTVCYMSIVGKKIEEPLYTLVGMVAGFYLGQHKPKPQ